MKTQIKYFAAILLMLSFFSSFAGAPAKSKAEVVNIQTSAVCESCKARIEKALKATDGVIEANLNLDNKKVKVKYNPEKITADQIRTAISKIGYDADNVKKTAEGFAKLPKCCQKAEGAACEHKK